MRQSRDQKPVQRKKIIPQIEDDLGDILYHLFKLAIAYDVDLGKAFEEPLNDIRKRYGKD